MKTTFGFKVQKRIASYPDRLAEASRIYQNSPEISTLKSATNRSESLDQRFQDFREQLRFYELSLKRAKRAFSEILASIESDSKSLDQLLNAAHLRNLDDLMFQSLAMSQIQLSQSLLFTQKSLIEIETQLTAIQVSKRALKSATEARDLVALARLKAELASFKTK